MELKAYVFTERTSKRQRSLQMADLVKHRAPLLEAAAEYDDRHR